MGQIGSECGAYQRGVKQNHREENASTQEVTIGTKATGEVATQARNYHAKKRHDRAERRKYSKTQKAITNRTRTRALRKTTRHEKDYRRDVS